MNISTDREKMLSEMTRAEKAELLQWIVRDLGDDFPGIESLGLWAAWLAMRALESPFGSWNRRGVSVPAKLISSETIPP